MIQSYKQKHELADRYDAILIGSGMGCLATAVCLAKSGKKVLVLERHYTVGGYTHVFKRRGYEWHAGIHYRASQQVAENNSARYFFPTDDAKANKYTNLPWVAQTSEVGGKKWTVQQMSHPDNPGENKRWSAYRDYGRFGEFPTIKIADGEKATLRYRFRVTKGEAPSRDQLNAAFSDFVK